MQIERMTLAVTNLVPTIAFYNAVFDAKLSPVAGMPFLYTGSFLGQPLLVCSNDVAGVNASQNRHQFRIAVPDLAVLRALVEANGGEVINSGAEGGRAILGIRDPDGNTYEFIAVAS